MSHFLTNTLLNDGYIAVFVLMLLASACIPLASEITMLFGGALANEAFVASLGSSGRHLNFVAVALVGIAGELVGSTIAWAVGYWGERELAERLGRARLIRTSHLDRAEQWFARHGPVTVFFGRLIPGVRSFISLAAGLAQMPYGPFILFTLAGSAVWCFGLAGAGYALGTEWKNVANYLQPIGYAALVILVVAVAWWIVRVIGRRRRDRSAESR